MAKHSVPALKVNNVVDFSMFRRIAGAFRGIFGGKRNFYDVFGYSYDPRFEDRLFKYLRQDIAARIVDAPAAALWTNPPQVTSTSEEWNDLWEDLQARHNIWSILERCDRLAGIGRYSILLIGFNDGSRLDTPVNTRAITQKSEKVLYLQPYSEASVNIVKYVSDPFSPDFMRPEIYRIQPQKEIVLGFNKFGNKSPQATFQAFDVHHSRIIHIAENCLENTIFGSPRMERVFNLLDDLLKVTGGAAETFWLIGNRGLHIDVDKDLEMDENDASALEDEIDEYSNQLRRVIRTRGTKVSPLGSDTPDPTGTFRVLIASLSGATGIPQRIILGSEAGQLASDQDRANWADRIDERRAGWANPQVIFPGIKKFVRAGYLPSSPEIEVTVEWPNAFKLSPLENAQTSAQHARSATNFANAIKTMEELKRGEPGTPDTTGPDGKVTPGTPAVEGIDLADLVTVDEARKFIGLDKPAVTFDSSEDLGTTQKRVHKRSVTVSQKSFTYRF